MMHPTRVGLVAQDSHIMHQAGAVEVEAEEVEAEEVEAEVEEAEEMEEAHQGRQQQNRIPDNRSNSTKLSGKELVIFDGDRTKAEAFLLEWVVTKRCVDSYYTVMTHVSK